MSDVLSQACGETEAWGLEVDGKRQGPAAHLSNPTPASGCPQEKKLFFQLLCAFWEPHRAGGHWSTQGCHLLQPPAPGSPTECICDHLTSFAVLMAFYELKVGDLSPCQPQGSGGRWGKLRQEEGVEELGSLPQVFRFCLAPNQPTDPSPFPKLEENPSVQAPSTPLR